MEHYRLEEIADGVLAAIARPDGGGRGNAGLVRVDNRTLVFDTGMTPQAGEELREAAERLGPVAWVVNSHFHADHCRGNQAFGAAEIIATAGTRELIETRAAMALADQKAVDFETYFASIPDHADRKEDLTYRERVMGTRQMAKTIANVELRVPTRTFERRLELAPGCELFTLGGGHTRSDGFLVLADRRVAFAGDLLAVGMHPWMGDGDPDHWIEILDEFATFNVDVLVPGHGRVATQEDVRVLRNHIQAFLADPENIESLYPGWDFWGDTADRNRAFLRERQSSASAGSDVSS